MNSGGPVTQ